MGVLRKLIVIVVAVVCIPGVVSAPKRKSASATSSAAITYNEKQKGDYNIRLHMKDFQIIALLGEDPLSGFDDYDYNYDYSDLTVKPVLPSFTVPPSRPTDDNDTGDKTSTPRPSTASSTERLPKPAEILLLLAQQGFPVVKPTELPSSVEHKITNAQINISISGTKLTTTTEKSPVVEQTASTVPVVVLQPTVQTANDDKKNKTTETTAKPEKGDEAEPTSQVLDQNANVTQKQRPFLYVPQIVFNSKVTVDSNEKGSENESVDEIGDGDKNDQKDKPGNDVELAGNPVSSSTSKPDDEPSMASSLPVRKRPGFSSGNVRMCALGFTRDKRGRCRRTRKPGQQIQYGVRLANMANQLKNAMTPAESKA